MTFSIAADNDLAARSYPVHGFDFSSSVGADRISNCSGFNDAFTSFQ
jgi:hypothetical protein